jgi:hypothetical protein
MPETAEKYSEIRHPDIFTAEEALAYLHLPADQLRTLETLRDKYGLVGFTIGKRMMYHRRHLDECVERMFGLAGCRQPMKLYGQSSTSR